MRGGERSLSCPSSSCSPFFFTAVLFARHYLPSDRLLWWHQTKKPVNSLRAESQTFLRVKRPQRRRARRNGCFRRLPIGPWFFPLFLVTIPEVIAKLNSAQTPRLSKASRKIAYNTKHHHACSTVYCYMAMVLRK